LPKAHRHAAAKHMAADLSGLAIPTTCTSEKAAAGSEIMWRICSSPSRRTRGFQSTA
jgi:hypothetical protein